MTAVRGDSCNTCEVVRYRVVHGGSNELLNHHFVFEAQRYALDLVKTGPGGFRAYGLWPEQLDAYRIWETPIMAPCSGEVVSLEATLPDMTPPEADREQAAGNHVAIHCQGVTVVLAHLRQHSIRHRVGAEVAATMRHPR